MAAQKYKISLQVLNCIFLQVSAANECKIFFVSPSGHVMFYLLYKHQGNTKPKAKNFFSIHLSPGQVPLRLWLFESEIRLSKK